MRISVVSLLFAFATSAAAQDVVKVGHLGITADAPVYIAIEKGYFKERNIEVKLEPLSAEDAELVKELALLEKLELVKNLELFEEEQTQTDKEPQRQP